MASITPILRLRDGQPIKTTIEVRIYSIQPADKSGKGVFRFSADGRDLAGKTIRMVAFNQKQTEKMEKIFKIGDVFTLSKFNLKKVNRQFNKLDSEFEIHLHQFSQVERVEESNIPPLKKKTYITIEEASEKNPGQTINIVAIIESLEDVQQEPSVKRKITIQDKDNSTVTLTIWGERAVEFSAKEKEIIVLQDVLVSAYEGFSLTANKATSVMVGDNIPKEDKTIEQLIQQVKTM